MDITVHGYLTHGMTILENWFISIEQLLKEAAGVWKKHFNAVR